MLLCIGILTSLCCNSIYVTRTTVTAYYNYRIETLSSRLTEQQAERAKTIKELKEATKYDRTQELLEKYGGVEARPRSRGDDDRGDAEDEDAHGKRPHQTMRGHPGAGMQGRTNLPPPPTANIQRRSLSPAAGSPQSGSGTAHPHQHGGVVSPNAIPVTEEFAPNAFSHTPPQARTQYDGVSGHHWYDRVLDLLLGEDETAAKNRIVLICQRCRLVNGQAPPGTKAMSELGMWKCFSCGATNGEMDEGQQIVRQVLEESGRDVSPPAESGPVRSDAEVEFEEEDGGYQDEVEPEVVGGVGDGPERKAASARRRKGRK